MRLLNKIIFYIIIIPVTVILVILSVGNKHNVSFFFNPIANPETIFQINAPLYMYIFVSFLAGCFIGYVFAKAKKNKKIKKQNKHIVKFNP